MSEIAFHEKAGRSQVILDLSNWVWVKGINNHADMVGYFYDTTDGSFHGFMRTR
jgi:hypothetical protein